MRNMRPRMALNRRKQQQKLNKRRIRKALGGDWVEAPYPHASGLSPDGWGCMFESYQQNARIIVDVNEASEHPGIFFIHASMSRSAGEKPTHPSDADMLARAVFPGECWEALTQTLAVRALHMWGRLDGGPDDPAIRP